MVVEVEVEVMVMVMVMVMVITVMMKKKKAQNASIGNDESDYWSFSLDITIGSGRETTRIINYSVFVHVTAVKVK